jgi:uncharacterized protein (DUF488 family)
MTAARFTTIGHSNRGLDEVIAMLRDAGVGLVIDVRAFPRSRANPVFNIDSLPQNLARVQIGYRHFPALGGRRPAQPGVDPSVNALWRVRSFHNYADHALGDGFAAAIADIVALAQTRRLALMCSEAVWWRCHRRIVTDYLLLNGHPVDHLMAPGQTAAATPTRGAVRRQDGRVVYPGRAAETG